jgi:hypothetical protein
MESKRLITLMMISFVVIFGWQMLIFKLYPPKPPGQATTAPSAATQPTVAVAATTTTTTTQATAATAPAPASENGDAKTFAVGAYSAIALRDGALEFANDGKTSASAASRRKSPRF